MEETNKMIPAKDKFANAVQVIKDAILQSQQRALGAVNQEQLALTMALADMSLLILGQRTGEKVLLRVSANNCERSCLVFEDFQLAT